MPLLLAFAPLVLLTTSPQASTDFPLNMHVVSSRLVWIGEARGTVTWVTVLLNREKLELEAFQLRAPLKPGNYPARLKPDKHKWPVAEDNRTFEVQMPDGKVMLFYVTAVFESPSAVQD